MFLEPNLHNYPTALPAYGWIEVICGSMFSGKTEELIRRLRRSLIAKQPVLVFKPALDVRYDIEKIVSHNQNTLESVPVSKAKEIVEIISSLEKKEKSDFKVIGIDEAQFFDAELPAVCQHLANQGKRIILAGLDMDFEGKPFGLLPELMAMAEFVTKVRAICVCCGAVASYSYRLDESQAQILLGEKESYEPRCRKCFFEGQKEKQANQIWKQGIK
ncbi:thymidine kinase [Hugenholtzia roseola]|uniref:thymidine kinase n=1 Tax=Hugenholtzia roseola TaxID=1002 RepID=UPI00041BC662|nr:thymidine kinase [Hugenholtzia roseola]